MLEQHPPSDTSLHQLAPQWTDWPRVLDRCFSLIYCAQPVEILTTAPVGFAEQHEPLHLIHGWGIFWACFGFPYKVLWLKLIVLMVLGRDFWIAVREGSVVGLLGIRNDRLTHLRLQSEECCIYTVHVADGCKGQRIGLLLLEEATKALLLPIGKKKLVLLETGEYNTSMIRMLKHAHLYKFRGVNQRPFPKQQNKNVL